MMENRNYMKCSQFEEIVHELDRPGTRGNELREEALIHAESCGHCGALLAEIESLDFALKGIAKAADGERAAAHVENNLLQEFRRVKGKPARKRMQWRIAVIGAAAALFLVLGLSLQRFYAPPEGRDRGSAANIEKNRAQGSTPDAPPQAAIQRNNESKPARPEVAAQANDELDETEIAENFTPLPYADDDSMMVGGSVVRVILSRSALASFGVPLSDAGNGEQIPADLVVSADGTPEAIHLVAQNEN